MGFARTKIQPPRPRPGAIERGTLLCRLDAALARCRLVLLAAPAGFGKTAVLASLVARQRPDTALAWVSCDEDDDLQRLLQCLCAALEPYDLPWRSDPDALAELAAGTRSQRRSVADELLNTLAAAERARGLLVLDDAHRVEDPRVFEFLEMLLAGLPSGWVLLLAGREPPPLPLARLRVQDELAEFRDRDLQFDAGEVDALLRATPGAAAHVDAAQLLARTQGWAVGLRLALNTLGSGPGDSRRLRSAALDRHVFDYLASEVLERMSEALQLFLMRCSVLPELSAARCAAVAQDERAAQWLEELEQRGLFVTMLDGPEPTLRVHDLFRDFLEDRLQRLRAGELPGLLRRAAASEDDPVRRIGYLLRAGATAEALDALGTIGAQLMTQGQVAPVLRMIEQFPRTLREGPQLQLLRGQGAWALWDFDTMCEAMHAAAAGHARHGEREGELLALAYEALALSANFRMREAEQLLSRLGEQALPDAARVCVLHTRVWQALDLGPFEELASRFSRELDQVERLDSALLWYHASPVARYLGAPGMVTQLHRFVRGALRHCQEGATPLRVLTLTMQAFLLLWAGRTDDAEAVLTAAEDDARWLGGMRGLAVQTHACRVLLHMLRSEADAARAAMQRPRELLEAEPDGPRRRMVLTAQQTQEARLCAWLGDVPRLRELSAQLARVPAQDVDAATDAQRRLLPAYVADAEGRIAEAIAIRRAALAQEPWLCRLGMGVETRLRLAAALLGPQGTRAAADVLQPVLQATDDDAEAAPVLFAGPVVLDTLARAPWHGRLPGDGQARLCRWADLAHRLRSAQPARAQAPAHGSLGELSPREVEVLERIAAGDSNKLIARAFDLSPHTVKRHVANILDKLGLQRRGQAAAWLRAHRR